TAIVAAETFSDLRTVATERAPFYLSARMVARAFTVAESLGHFTVDEVSPVAAAARIAVPVLLIHGALDRDTPPDHSRRVFAALTWSCCRRSMSGSGASCPLHSSSSGRSWWRRPGGR